MYSTIVDGKVLDWHFKKRQTDTVFYIGNIFVGQIFKIGKVWSAVGASPSNGICPVHGFATRRHAAEFLLKLEGYTN